LTKLGCGGESTRSMRFGSQDPPLVSSCGTQRFYQHRYPKGTQLAQAIHFLTKHRGKVDLITIDIGANDLSRLDDQGNEDVCLFEPQGCDAQHQQIATNLAAILAQLHAAAPGVPVIGMTYYNFFAPIWYSDPELGQLISDRIDKLNKVLDTGYADAASPVADVAVAFESSHVATIKIGAPARMPSRSTGSGSVSSGPHSTATRTRGAWLWLSRTTSPMKWWCGPSWAFDSSHQRTWAAPQSRLRRA
jgi:lysophospholipase L1-like esterase